ncbi:MAG TPA: acetamidase/formamidase family protein, partial [Bryobacteraceae bacterium]|nr:acetamidase/formamidase family protein [Bryobacteraceae bacterium]
MRVTPIAACLLLLATSSPRCYSKAALLREWLLTTDIYGNSLHQRLTILAKGEDLGGTLDGNPVAGKISGTHLHFIATDKRNNTTEVDAQLGGDKVTGEMSVTLSNAPEEHVRHSFSGYALKERPAGPPRNVEFKPTKFYNRFSAEITPVLTVWPGDTIHTQTIDSGGVDEHGVTKALYGNPQTGPFYVGGAESGDVLAVHINRLRLNRVYADSLDAIAERVKDSRLAVQAKDLGQRVRWKLDFRKGIAKPDLPTEHLRDFTVPLKPMLGCVGVAPDFGFAPFSTGELGRYGGNMDFNEITEGSTVFLNVAQPGALLYIGDGHAAMGDGETTEWALETSMDVEFSVHVIKHGFIASPRVETATHYAAIGIAGSIDDATRRATSGMVQWLQQEYH